jgi:hypothetical protein
MRRTMIVGSLDTSRVWANREHHTSDGSRKTWLPEGGVRDVEAELSAGSTALRLNKKGFIRGSV